MARKHKRSSLQQRFGSIGESQLSIRFRDYGWEPGIVVPDTGEDYIVKILDGEYSSGLAFYAQVKSKYSEDRILKNGGIGRRIETKDLDEHWRDHVPPVFIFGWDVTKNSGYWISAADAIAQLDSRKPSWRDQATVEVRIPSSNKTDNAGLSRLRYSVALHAEPIIATGKTLNINLKLAFSNDLEGYAAVESLKLYHEEGEPAQISGKFIKGIRFSDWYERLYGSIENWEDSCIQLGFTPSEQSIPVRLQMFSSNGRRIAAQNIDVRLVKRGTQKATLTNSHNPSPFYCQFILERLEAEFNLNVTISLIGAQCNVKEARDAIPFLNALAAGGKLRFEFFDDRSNSEFHDHNIEPNSFPSFSNDAIALIDKLCFIQQRIGCKLNLQDWACSEEDKERINEVACIIETGVLKQECSEVNIPITSPFPTASEVLQKVYDGHLSGRRAIFILATDDIYTNILNTKIPLGGYKQQTIGTLKLSQEEFEKAMATLKQTDALNILLENATQLTEFVEWLPENYVSKISSLDSEEVKDMKRPASQ
ncbi:MAG: DUF4365 domain-containing protein [Abitibacteriaceae bacterium]|nr:DUF4365 domain-containing protein [Abditibacteriaceae bacterium]